MARFDDGCKTAIRFPAHTAPPVPLRSTAEAFERGLPQLNPAALRPIPTGFPQLDANMGGGLHAEDLVLVVGERNVGKTVFVCQLGRNISRWAALMRNRVVCLLVCYEHSPSLLLQRLLCMESWLAGGSEGGVSLAQIGDALADLAEKGELEDVSSLLLRLPKTGLLGWRAMEKYLETLYLHRGDPVYTSPEAIDKMVAGLQGQGLHPAVIVDHVQRVPLRPDLFTLGREQHIKHVVRALKALALGRGVPVVAVGAVDEQGIKRRGPVHLEDLGESIMTTCEPDVGWVMNREYMRTTGEDSAARAVRLAIKRNRHGPSGVEWRHDLYGERFCLQPGGSVVPARRSSWIRRMRSMGGT
ncbi:MAG: DnaB-like helicase C-terminal domain-containing protein [Chloroflexota bacterium]